MSHVITAADIPSFQRVEYADSLDEIKSQFTRLRVTQVKLVDEMRSLVLEKQGPSSIGLALSNYCFKQDRTQSLNDDTLIQILIKLDFSDIVRAASVCQRFHKILKGNALWTILLKENVPEIYRKLNGSLDLEKWIALGKFNFALADLNHRITRIEKDQRMIAVVNYLTVAAAAPILTKAALSLVASGLCKLATVREANILAQAQEYVRTHPEAILETAKKVVTTRINELINIMC